MARRLIEPWLRPRLNPDKRLSYMQRARKIWGDRGERGPAFYMKDRGGNYFRFTRDQIDAAIRAGFKEVPAKEFDDDFMISGGDLIMRSAGEPKNSRKR